MVFRGSGRDVRVRGVRFDTEKRPRLAARLGAIERSIRTGEQSLEFHAELWRRRDADTDRYGHRYGIDQIRLADLTNDPAGKQFRLAFVTDSRLQHDEFVTAEARHDIVGTNDIFEAPRHLLEQQISCGVPITIVDRLEAIEIEIVERDEAPCANCCRGTILEKLTQQQPVRKSGQGIGSRKLRHVMPGRVMLHGRVIEVSDGLETEPHYRGNDKRFNEE